MTEKMEELLDGLNDEQRAVVTTTQGPVLVIAGPGSGKTLTLIRRTLNILKEGLATPEEIVLCTFTEKAALEIRDRLSRDAKRFGINTDLSSLVTGTIHGIANSFIEKYRHHTRLGNGYDVLDELTQKLFINDNFDEIVGERAANGKYLSQWSGKWSTIEELVRYLNKIAEELVDPASMVANGDPFQQELGEVYVRYRNKLEEANKIDFAHLQVTFLDLLRSAPIGGSIKSLINYVMVDEYQDTNFVQEQMMMALCADDRNLCVVGDEDQALYRFRGATVRNILEFPEYFTDCAQITLSTNYRSHSDIVEAYDAFMSDHNWTSDDGRTYRFDKSIVPDPTTDYVEYPAVVSAVGSNVDEEAASFADLVVHLKSNGIIEDYSQVAYLMYSVKDRNSKSFIQALADRGIPAFCPRAGKFFDTDEIRVIVAVFALVLDYNEDTRGPVRHDNKDMVEYVEECIEYLQSRYGAPMPLAQRIEELRTEIAELDDKRNLDRRLADFLYEVLPFEPFAGWLRNGNRAHHLSTVSALVSTFQKYYGVSVLTAKNINFVRMSFFNSFLRLLYASGMNEYEDLDLPFPKGHVQFLTIHQSKGLEFPVVAVGSLSSTIRVMKKVDETLAPFMNRGRYEDLDRISGFDRMRLFYVAFSRAQKVLVLSHSADKNLKSEFKTIVRMAPDWRTSDLAALSVQRWEDKPGPAVKRAFSFTRDVKVFETCPRQYEMYRHLEFEPSRAAMVVFGLVVHQTIEDIHRTALNGTLDEVDEGFLRERFDFNYRHLSEKQARQLAPQQREIAFTQVVNYWRENLADIKRVQATEVDVSLEKDGYVLVGAIDLVLSDVGSLEILDFKAQKKPTPGSEIIDTYYKQLCIYAHILENRLGRRPDRLVLYWTSEDRRDDARMEFDYDPSDVDSAIQHFGSVVDEIQRQNFVVKTPPDQKVCNECDFRALCTSDGTISGSSKKSPRTSRTTK